MAESESIRVLVVDRYKLIRAGIARVIESDPRVVTVATCGGTAEAISALTTTPIDVVVLDYQSESMQEVTDLIPIARDNGFSGAFLVITADLQDTQALDLLKRGAAGLVSRSDPPEVLTKAIRRLYEGRWWIKDQHIKLMIASIGPKSKAESRNELSTRELTVLRALLKGQSNKQIALELGITESAIKSTLQHLFKKTGTRNRGQLIRFGLEHFQMKIEV